MSRSLSIGLVLATLLLMAASAEPARSQQVRAPQPPPGVAAPGASGQAGVAENPDLASLRQSAATFVEAFNRGDAAAVAALWTPDGEYIDDRGRKFIGREAIEQGYAEFFAENPGTTLELQIEALRLLSPSTAMEDGQAVSQPAGGGPSTVSEYSVVHVKVDGRWLMASVRDALVADFTRGNMADLGWLIGSWTAEEHGVKTESQCRWIGDKSFVERSYTTTGLDGAKTTGLQIIGWNALDGQVHSWNFSPDGSFAIGVWAPIEGGWEATITGATADGTPTTATNRLRRLDDNAYVWQSVDRSLGDAPIPDTGEVVVRRSPAK